MFKQTRVARFSTVARKFAAAQTDTQLIAAPGAGNRLVIDELYFNTSVAGTVEIKGATGAWVDATGVMGGSFAANGGLISLFDFEMPDNLPLLITTTGATPVQYVTVVYHIES